MLLARAYELVWGYGINYFIIIIIIPSSMPSRSLCYGGEIVMLIQQLSGGIGLAEEFRNQCNELQEEILFESHPYRPHKVPESC